ncbi:MAG: hypothetical protein ACM3JH_14905 [Acidithiobacillales bacterium]
MPDALKDSEKAASAWKAAPFPVPVGLYLILYAAIFLLALLAGYRMQIPWAFHQLLDEPLLQGKLGESIVYLHGQPPLLNLALGLTLKLARATTVAPETLLAMAHFLLGAALVAAFATLFREVLGPGLLAPLGTLFFLLNPMLYVSLLEYFYTAHELLLLALFGLFARRFLQTGRAGTLAGAGGCLAALAALHSLYHFAAMLALIAGLTFLAPPTKSGRSLDASRVLVLAASTVALLAWPAKNLLVFGFFGSSSWVGLNLASGLGVSYPPLARLFLPGPSPPSEALRAEASRMVPKRFERIAALAELTKQDGSPNWNHFSVIELSRQTESRVLHRLRGEPALLLDRAWRNYRAYALFSGRHPLQGSLDWKVKGPASRLWLESYERLAFQYFGRNTREEPFTGFFTLFPLMMTLAVVRTARCFGSRPVEARTVLVLLLVVLWVLGMVLFVDGREGNRLRFPTDPFIILLALWGLSLVRDLPRLGGGDR